MEKLSFKRVFSENLADNFLNKYFYKNTFTKDSKICHWIDFYLWKPFSRKNYQSIDYLNMWINWLLATIVGLSIFKKKQINFHEKIDSLSFSRKFSWNLSINQMLKKLIIEPFILRKICQYIFSLNFSVNKSSFNLFHRKLIVINLFKKTFFLKKIINYNQFIRKTCQSIEFVEYNKILKAKTKIYISCSRIVCLLIH